MCSLPALYLFQAPYKLLPFLPASNSKEPSKLATCQSDANAFWHQQDTETGVISLGFSNYTACCEKLNQPWMSFCSCWLGGCSLFGPWHLTMLNYECATNHTVCLGAGKDESQGPFLELDFKVDHAIFLSKVYSQSPSYLKIGWIIGNNICSP